ncbi:hypothetical protein WKW77_14550 [Variovorax ureilyticus]|uniref:Uncharacterized protein n=1 Tax=Variovorax ureilyticus TaxID=1836198 RepID=A0ABU8VFE4_9BURK
MKRAAKLLLFLLAVAVSSIWLTRLWLELQVPLPITDGMVDFALAFYGAQNQEESTDALALLGWVTTAPLTAIFFWSVLGVWKRYRACQPR